MTNNTQLVSVPRELLERINRVSFLPVAIASELGDILTCPAEDVRAVVDEPVAWMNDCNNSYPTFKQKLDADNFPEFWTALYRHPQRPVVMPARRAIVNSGKYAREDREWNACLDEFKRLNP